MKNDEPGSEFSLLIREILSHLAHHPDAKDSVEGIHNFWLSQQTHHWSREKVREVLDYLVDDRGWLTRKLSGAAVALYGLDKKYLTEVQNFLSGGGNAN